MVEGLLRCRCSSYPCSCLDVPGQRNPVVSAAASAALSWCLQTPGDTARLSSDQARHGLNSICHSTSLQKYLQRPANPLHFAPLGLSQFKVSLCKERGWRTRRGGWKGTFSHLKGQYPSRCAPWRRNRGDSWVMHPRRTLTMPQSKVSALALCFPAVEHRFVLPRVGGHRSCQNKCWCGGERRCGKALGDCCRWSQKGLLAWFGAGCLLAAHCKGNQWVWVWLDLSVYAKNISSLYHSWTWPCVLTPNIL